MQSTTKIPCKQCAKTITIPTEDLGNLFQCSGCGLMISTIAPVCLKDPELDLTTALLNLTPQDFHRPQNSEIQHTFQATAVVRNYKIKHKKENLEFLYSCPYCQTKLSSIVALTKKCEKEIPDACPDCHTNYLIAVNIGDLRPEPIHKNVNYNWLRNLSIIGLSILATHLLAPPLFYIYTNFTRTITQMHHIPYRTSVSGAKPMKRPANTTLPNFDQNRTQNTIQFFATQRYENDYSTEPKSDKNFLVPPPGIYQIGNSANAHVARALLQSENYIASTKTEYTQVDKYKRLMNTFSENYCIEVDCEFSLISCDRERISLMFKPKKIIKMVPDISIETIEKTIFNKRNRNDLNHAAVRNVLKAHQKIIEELERNALKERPLSISLSENPTQSEITNKIKNALSHN